ncbi:MAG: AtpZ/AtpI family protein [Terracidiphilus sp.]
MPFHRAIPESKPPAKSSGGFSAYVEAEKLMQIAFVLPSAVVVGLLLGMGADHLLHQKWIVIVGIILGSISGLVFVVQTAVAAEKKSQNEDAAQNETGKGSSDDPS